MSAMILLSIWLDTRCSAGCRHNLDLANIFHLPHKGVALPDVLRRHFPIVPEATTNIATIVQRSSSPAVANPEAVVILFLYQGRPHAYIQPPDSSREYAEQCLYRVRMMCLDRQLVLATKPEWRVHIGARAVQLTETRMRCVLTEIAQAPPSEPESARPLVCYCCYKPPSEFAIESCGHLTRCVPCALKDRWCPLCDTELRRAPRNRLAIEAV